MVAVRQEPCAAQVFYGVFQVGVRIQQIFRTALKTHTARCGGQNLQQPLIGTVARTGAVGAFADGQPMNKGTRDIIKIRPLVDLLAQLRRLIGIKWWASWGRGRGRRSATRGYGGGTQDCQKCAAGGVGHDQIRKLLIRAAHYG